MAHIMRTAMRGIALLVVTHVAIVPAETDVYSPDPDLTTLYTAGGYALSPTVRVENLPSHWTLNRHGNRVPVLEPDAEVTLSCASRDKRTTTHITVPLLTRQIAWFTPHCCTWYLVHSCTRKPLNDPLYRNTSPSEALRIFRH